jgi:hypothetical protein
MSPERETAIRYLAAQLQKYREELGVWLRGPAIFRTSFAQSRIIAPLQGLIEDATRLLARLRGKPVAANDSEPARQDLTAPAKEKKG